ncbi:phosphatidylglycerol lysyltransferase domain-containing protein [Phaeovulum vinaykumarii]|uniref:Phosphatidylglycerol lysyltransferase n=1 Tax=Phaeovulum vinaykumarii TaxID=407234 RepID=A0A1N7ME78_9RHOB|nr:phosphatidylglycerol lysyltransferase domain-containing protein [Phaeovulum vinaykumarii]SIS84384.1 phosphatidylglycerol lysyltransferase [Phaeovulum vinaykumarii]SOC11742.1 phosphatidylglycerol lysyltransferase [Phaeovulum vinaykumarii]
MTEQRAAPREGRHHSLSRDLALDMPARPQLAAAGLPRLSKALLRQAAVIGALVFFAWLLRERLAALDTGAILAAVGDVSAAQWAGALAATLISFLAVGQYDAVVHRMLGTGQPAARARISGAAAIAVGQTLGLGLVTGALVRWRLLPGAGLAEASRITAAVTASFLAGWAVVTALALVLLGAAFPGAALIGLAGLAGAGALMGLMVMHPQLRIGRWTLRTPSLPVVGRVLVLTFIDTFAAAAALWILLPDSSPIPLLALFPAFLLAQGAGLVSGTPGGVGPFEMALVALLPGTQAEPLLAAILAWRVVYYALPAMMGAGAMILRPMPRRARARTPRPDLRLRAQAPRPRIAPPAPELTPHLARLVAAAPQAELGLLRQGEHGVLMAADGTGGWMAGRTPQALVAIRDPFGTPAAALLSRLRAEAIEQGRVACLYKVGGRAAAAARRAGWHVVPVAREAWIDTARFTEKGAARAGLRRKLRKAEKAGLRIELAHAPLPLAPMAQIATEWTAARGGERGFSMGRFAPHYVAGQKVLLAWMGDDLVAFASFHASDSEWVLDLMRPGAAAPEGTMHALIVAAVAEARAAGARRLSLAALPPPADTATGPAALIWKRAEKGNGTAGLRQFKEGFGPSWETLYIAAPTRGALTLAAMDIARQIRRPGPLPASPLTAPPRIAPASRGGAPRIATPHRAVPGEAAPAQVAPRA